MKTFVVISDSHGKRKKIEQISHLFSENDYIVHLGDGAGDMRETFSQFPEKTWVCRGNCDLISADEEFVLEEDGVRIFCCHGHRYGVKHGLYKLVMRAKELDCAVALYGHTHNASDLEIDGVRCINPGSLGAIFGASYCYLIIHNGKITATNVPVL